MQSTLKQVFYIGVSTMVLASCGHTVEPTSALAQKRGVDMARPAIEAESADYEEVIVDNINPKPPKKAEKEEKVVELPKVKEPQIQMVQPQELAPISQMLPAPDQKVKALHVSRDYGVTVVTEHDEDLIPKVKQPAPKPNDGGIVIAETTAYANVGVNGTQFEQSDCVDGHYGVMVTTKLGETRYVYNGEGEPCGSGQTIFDGMQSVNQRGTKPSIKIGMKRKYKLNEPNMFSQIVSEEKSEIVAMGYEPQTPEEVASINHKVDHSALDVAPASGGFASQIGQMQEEEEYQQIVKEAETLLADYRSLERLSSNELIRVHQDKILDLEAKLRHAERQLAMSAERRKMDSMTVEDARNQIEAERLARAQFEERMRQQLEAKEGVIKKFEEENRSLVDLANDKEEAMRQRLARVEGNLREAEWEADKARQEIVLEAAKKIAEAERLAFEARLAERSAMERKALLMKTEAENMMRRASAIGDGHAIVVPALSSMDIPKFEGVRTPVTQEGVQKRIELPQSAVDEIPTTLEEVTVTLRAEDETLADILDDAVAFMADRVGEWEIAWKLKPQNQGILHDKWTIVAESRFDELLAYIAQKVQQSNGVQLSFNRFDNSKLLVISDE